MVGHKGCFRQESAGIPRRGGVWSPVNRAQCGVIGAARTSPLCRAMKMQSEWGWAGGSPVGTLYMKFHSCKMSKKS